MDKIKENEDVFKIKIGEVYKPVIEDYERSQESIFKSIYDKGRVLVKEICDRSKDINNNSAMNYSGESYNNIIAFIGERGTGKTSAMNSFANLLLDRSFLEKDSSKQSHIEFCSLDMIDPTRFDENVNILEIILATMFKRFKEKAKDIETSERQKLIAYFDNVYKNLKCLKNDSNNVYKGESLEGLLEMAASIEIKGNLMKLVEVYLDQEACSNVTKGNGILVIQIDDMDLNTKHAYAMVEELRKYLTLPKVVILMALKMDQLHDVVNQAHYQSLQYLPKGNGEDDIKHKITDMTEKYLSKLIPIDHRLILPEMSSLSTNNKFIIQKSDTESENFPSIEHGIRELIYRKTGLHFIKPDRSENLIVPQNLRELVNLVQHLMSFEDIKIPSRVQLENCIEAITGKAIEEILKENKKIKIEEFAWLLDCPKMEYEKDWEELYKKNKSTLALLFLSKSEGLKELQEKLREVLDEVESKENEKEHQYKLQVEKFKQYFLSYWCQNKISKEGLKLLERFLACDLRKRNKFIIDELERIFEIRKNWDLQIEYLSSKGTRFDEFSRVVKDMNEKMIAYKKVTAIVNHSINISVGDVIFVLSMLEKIDTLNETQNLIFAIKTLYHIELTLLNFSIGNQDEDSIFEDVDLLIGGEYFSSDQRSLMPMEKESTIRRDLKEGKWNAIQFEVKNMIVKNLDDEILDDEILDDEILDDEILDDEILDDEILDDEILDDEKLDIKLKSLLFINLMFKRSGNTEEMYRTFESPYYDFYNELSTTQDNYELSIMSPFCNGAIVSSFLKTKAYNASYISKELKEIAIKELNNEKRISNIALIEYLLMTRISKKEYKDLSNKNITAYWNQFFKKLSKAMCFYDGVSYFSIFNMNFMKVFRRSSIENINIDKDRLDLIIGKMKNKLTSTNRKQMGNYWKENYEEMLSGANALEEMNIRNWDRIITEMTFYKVNERSTSYKPKQELVQVLEKLYNNDEKSISILLNESEKDYFERNPEQKSNYAKKLYDDALRYYKEKQYEKSIDLCDKAIILDSEKNEYWSHLGLCYYNMGSMEDYEKGIKALNKAIELDDNIAKNWNMLGVIYFKQGSAEDYSNAIKAFAKAAELDSEIFSYYKNLGISYQIRNFDGDIEKALKIYEIALEKSNDEKDKKEIQEKIDECRKKLDNSKSK